MLTHINEKGYAKMVDISEKDDTKRTAVATATITLSKEALEKVKNGQIKKGDTGRNGKRGTAAGRIRCLRH